MKQRLPLVLSSTAVIVAVLGATPLGHATRQLVRTVPFAKKAGYATKAGVAANALALNGHKSSTSPSGGTIPVLDAQGNLPSPIRLERMAFALVDPNGGSPRLVSGRTTGFVDVSSLSTGDYFLTPASGVDLTTTSAVASEEASLSAVFGFALIRYAAAGALNCRADQLEVKTATDNPPELSNKVAFTVIVP